MNSIIFLCYAIMSQDGKLNKLNTIPTLHRLSVKKKIIVFLSEPTLTLYLLVSFADNFFKQIGPKLFDTLIVFLKEFFRKT